MSMNLGRTCLFLVAVLTVSLACMPADAAGTYVSGTIASSRTWTPAGSPYLIDGEATVASGVTLTIDPGTVVKFANYTCRIVNYGTITALGTSANRIYFTSIADDSIGGDTNGDGSGSSPARGNWNHILTTGSGATASFAYCDVRYGGWFDPYVGWSYPSASLACTAGASMTVDHCTVTESGTNGIHYDAVSSPQVTNSTVSNSSGHGIYMNVCPSPVLDDNALTSNAVHAAHLDGPITTLSFNRNSGTGNGINGLLLNSNYVTGAGRWYATNGLPYVIEGQLTIEAGNSLTIDPGTISKFANYTCRIVNYGTITAQGTSENRICFTSIADDTIGGDTNNDGGANAPVRGNWNHIWVTGSGASGTFAYCDARYGGWYDPYTAWSYPDTNLGCSGGATMTVDHCTLTESGTNGIYYKDMPSPHVTNSTVSRNASHGVYMVSCASPVLDDNLFANNGAHAAHLDGPVGTLNFNRNAGTGNAVNGLFLNNNTVENDSRWYATNGLPYVIENQLTVNPQKTLTIDPGTILKFNTHYSRIVCNGGISAVGTAASRICFTSITDDMIGGDTNNDSGTNAPGPANWNHIWVTGSGSTAMFAYCDVKYGGWYDPYTAWSYPGGNLGCTDGGSMTVDHCSVYKSGTSGIFYDGMTSPSVTNSAIYEHSSHGIYMNNCPSPVLDDNVFSANTVQAAHIDGPVAILNFNRNSGTGSGVNGLFLNNNTVTGAGRWYATNGLPYVIEGQLTIEAGNSLTIDPGTIVKFNTYYSRIQSSGVIVAEGTADSRICFTSIADDTIGGDTNNGTASGPGRAGWNHIWTTGSGAIASFAYCDVRYGGWYDPYTGWSYPGGNLGCTAGASMTVSHCSVAESGTSGVYYDGVPSPHVTNSTLSANSAHGVYMNNSPSPILDDNVFGSNTAHAAHMDGTVGTLRFNRNSGTGSGVNGLFLANNTVSADSRWSAVDSMPLVVENRLYVSPGVTLTIDPGDILKFNSYYSRIDCNGSIVAHGTALQPIYFTSLLDDSIGGDTNNDGSASDPGRNNWNHIWASGSGAKADFEYCVVRYGGWYDGYNGWSWPNASLAATDGAGLAVRNCSVAESGTIGLYSTTSGSVLENSAVVSNTSQGVYLDTSACRVAYSDLWGNGAGDYTGVNPIAVGNISADPMFVNLTAGDYHLQDASPCMNAGDPSKLDLDGSRLDIGALPNLRMGILTAKDKADDNPVAGVRGIVTAVFGDTFYIESSTRYSGIRVRKPGHTAMVGQSANVAGTMRTDDGERYIDATSVALSDGKPIRPLGATCRSIGGSGWHYDAATGSGQRGISWASGLNNVGLLVRVWGKVVCADAGFLYLDDGLGVADSSGYLGVRVEVNGLPVPAQDTYVEVAGVSSCFISGSDLFRLIRAVEIVPQLPPDL